MSEHNTNLWAPWRMEYIRSFRQPDSTSACFLCDYWASPNNDRSNFVVHRTSVTFLVLNRFPYTNGHLLVATGSHKGDFDALTDEEICALGRSIREGVSLLKATLNPQGFNVGYNLGHCAGAGLPGHLHAHIVPRWNGDTNFMAVLDNIRIIPESLQSMWEQINACSVRIRAQGA